MKASTSLGVGGNPVRSMLSRLMSVARSASGEGANPSASSLASTKRSIGVRIQSVRRTFGGSGRFGATNAQCGSYFAPSAIQRSSSFFCSAESRRFDFGGGIRSPGSALMRRTSSLAAASFGTIAFALSADSATSSRRSAFRLAGSWPWQ